LVAAFSVRPLTTFATARRQARLILAVLPLVQRERVIVLEPRPDKAAPVGADKMMSVRTHPTFELVLQVNGIDPGHKGVSYE
jgi:hypothetical protein